MQNIYQTPSVPRPTSSSTYERMDMIYKVPSTSLFGLKGPDPSAFRHSTEGYEGNKVQIVVTLMIFVGFRKEFSVAVSWSVSPRSKSFLLLGKC